MTGPFSLTIPDPLQVKPNSATIWCTCLGFDFDGDAVYTGDGQWCFNLHVLHPK